MRAAELDSAAVSAGITLKVMREIVLPENETAKKLENFLKKAIPNRLRPKAVSQEWRAPQRPARQAGDDLVRAGDRIQLYIHFESLPKRSSHAPSSAPKLEIIYEDDALLVHQQTAQALPCTKAKPSASENRC